MTSENTSLVTQILDVCSKVKKPRSLYYVLAHTMEEVGELSTEVGIEMDSHGYKTPGPDGIVGESVDAIICLVDMVYVHLKDQGLSPAEIDDMLKSIAATKLDKWLKTSE